MPEQESYQRARLLARVPREQLKRPGKLLLAGPTGKHETDRYGQVKPLPAQLSGLLFTTVAELLIVAPAENL